MKKMTASFSWRNIAESRLFFPILALVIILLVDLILIPGFFKFQVRGSNLYGSLIDIFRNGSTVAILAIGMTLVIATGGIDLSVGAIMAIAASVAALLMNPYVLGKELSPQIQALIRDPQFTWQPLWIVLIVTLLVAIMCGVWNGLLVAYGKIQPMVATLILMIAGRGIAQLITNGVRIQIFYDPYAFIGQGWIVLPFCLYLVAIIYVLTWLFTRKTSIGMFIESIGINARSSFYSGISERKIKMLVYIFCGLCAGIAGLVASANIKTSDANNIGWGLELDAILAVVIGGTSMSGGRFSILASIIGAMVMQAVTTSMYAVGVPAFALQAIKGVVVILVIMLYSKQVRELFQKLVVERKET
jgi:ribose/xylose/arabinose/galactoside ABC-type transport system permease subunit